MNLFSACTAFQITWKATAKLTARLYFLMDFLIYFLCLTEMNASIGSLNEKRISTFHSAKYDIQTH